MSDQGDSVMAEDDDALIERYGIETVTEVFYRVGGHRYARLADAVAEAKRESQVGASEARNP